MNVIIVNNTKEKDPADSLVQQFKNYSQQNTIFISHELPSDPENWIFIDEREMLDKKYADYAFYLKTAKISHKRHVYRYRDPNVIPITPSETPIHNPLNETLPPPRSTPAISACTCTAPAGHRTKICNSCDHYEIETQTCERYPKPLDMANITKFRCGDFRGCSNAPLETPSRKEGTR